MILIIALDISRPISVVLSKSRLGYGVFVSSRARRETPSISGLYTMSVALPLPRAGFLLLHSLASSAHCHSRALLCFHSYVCGCVTVLALSSFAYSKRAVDALSMRSAPRSPTQPRISVLALRGAALGRKMLPGPPDEEPSEDMMPLEKDIV